MSLQKARPVTLRLTFKTSRNLNSTNRKATAFRTVENNPTGEAAPNKKYYDPRVWLRAGQSSMVTRLEKAFADLNAIDVL